MLSSPPPGAATPALLFPGVLWAKVQEAGVTQVTPEIILDAARVAGLELTQEQAEAMVEEVEENSAQYQELREAPLGNEVALPLHFNPRVSGLTVERAPTPVRASTHDVERPADLETAAFWPITQLAHLTETRQVTSLELTDMYLGRLKRHGPALNCVVTLTEERARAQAVKADEEIAAGRYRGTLHGIPYGVKDIIAVRGYPTTWGAAAFADRVIDQDATVVQRLDEAGAVLVAKLTTGELAFGDRWFGGRTNNPWNPEVGSSGSSAGSGAATAAGLVGLLGSKTPYGLQPIAPFATCRTGSAGLLPRCIPPRLAFSPQRAGVTALLSALRCDDGVVCS